MSNDLPICPLKTPFSAIKASGLPWYLLVMAFLLVSAYLRQLCPPTYYSNAWVSHYETVSRNF